MSDEDELLRPFLAQIASKRDALLQEMLTLTPTPTPESDPSPSGIVLTLAPAGPLPISELWAVSDSLADLGPLLQAWARALYHQLLQPWAEGRLEFASLDRLAPARPLRLTLTPALAAPSPPSPPLLDGSFVRALSAALEAVAEDLLGGNPTLVAIFGREWADLGLVNAVRCLFFGCFSFFFQSVGRFSDNQYEQLSVNPRTHCRPCRSRPPA